VLANLTLRCIFAATMLLVPHASVAAGEVSEAELVKRTTLEPAELSRRRANVAAMTAEQLGVAMEAAVKDRTIVYYQPGHGVFVEHTSADGKVFMWYPRNRKIVYGTWGLRDFGGPKLCYKYLASVHGVTGEYEPTECIPPAQKLIGAEILDSCSGDPFGLAAGKIPYSKTAFDVPEWPTQ
jgi:hypothetical protein